MTEPGTDVAVPVEDMTGLEDFDASDAVVPRLQISHENATLVDSLTNEEFSELDVVVLGLIKQRILWDTEVNEGDRPLCKSYDFKIGHPDPPNFPWDSTPFERDDFDAENPELDCGSCTLKDWGSHPSRDAPWCTAQYVLPLIIPMDDDHDMGAPAILTLQRSSLKPAKGYISGFARARTPLYTVRTKIKLDALRRGSVRYAVPEFKKLDPTNEDAWPEFAAAYRSIREFVATPRSNVVEDDGESGDAGNASKVASKAAESDEPTASTTTDGDDDGEIPF